MKTTNMIRLAIGDVGSAGADLALVLRDLRSAQVVALVEADQDRKSEIADQLDIGVAAGDWNQLFESHADEFDAVVSFSQSMIFGEFIERAVERDKHMLVNGPIDPKTAAALAKPTGTNYIMVTWPLRMMPYQQAVRQSLDAGQLGLPGLVRVHHWNSTLGQPADDDSLTRLVVHEVDVVCWLFDAWPALVYATAMRTGDLNTSQGVQIHLGFPGGGMALIDCVNRPTSESPPYFSLSMIGSQGAAYADDHHNINLLLNEQGVSGLAVDQGRLHCRTQLEDFVSAISDGRKMEDSVSDSRRAMAVVAAVEAAASSGGAYRLQGGDYEPC